MKAPLIFLLLVSLAVRAHAFDPAGPPPERTMAWTIQRLSDTVIPNANFEGASLAEIIKLLNQPEIPKTHKVRIAGDALGPKLEERITLNARNITHLSLIGKVAHLAEADIRIGAGYLSLLPKTRKSVAVVPSTAPPAAGINDDNINQELAGLFNARHVAALVPAKESRIDDIDPLFGDRTFGMIFNPSDAFALEEGSFETALESAKIKDWTFDTRAPWSPGKQIHWVALDSFGTPFLSLRLIEDQPALVKISQLIEFSEGAATLGRAHHRYFRCELSSKDLVAFLRKTAKERAAIPFTPTALKPNDHAPSDPFTPDASR